MSQEATHISQTISDLFNPEHVRELLDKPFPPEAVKTRPGHFGQTLSYVEAHEYVRRLNEVFGIAWSFEILLHEVQEKEVLVLGKLNTNGFVRMAFGGSQVTRAKETGETVSIADDLKAAATDAFKKACSFLGLGLHLYAGGSQGQGVNQFTPQGDEKQTTKPNNGNGNGSSRLSSKQLSYILSLGQEKGMNYPAIKAKTMEIFGRVPEFLTKAEASTVIQELMNL